MEAKVAVAVDDLPTTTIEVTTTRREASEPPKTEPTRPTTTEAPPETKPVRPVEAKPTNFELRLECGTRTVENAVMKCACGNPSDGVKEKLARDRRERRGSFGHRRSLMVRAPRQPGFATLCVEGSHEGGIVWYATSRVTARPPLALRLPVSPRYRTKLGVGALSAVNAMAFVLSSGAQGGDGARELGTTVLRRPRRYFDLTVQPRQHYVVTRRGVDGDAA